MRKIIKLALISLIISLSLYLTSGPMASENWKIALWIENGSISGEFIKAPLKEIIRRIGEVLRIEVECYGEIDQDRLVSDKFENLTYIEFFSRIFRQENFFYIESKKVGLLGFADPALFIIKNNNETPIQKTQPQKINLNETFSNLESKSPNHNRNFVRNPDNESRTEKPKKEINLKKNEMSNISEKMKDNEEATSLEDQIFYSSSPLTFPILLEPKGKEISALSMEILYDPEVLKNPKLEIGEAAKRAEKNVVYHVIRPGWLRVGIIGLNQKIIPEGQVVNVTFDVLKQGKIILKHKPAASDPNGNLIPVAFKNGKISVIK